MRLSLTAVPLDMHAPSRSIVYDFSLQAITSTSSDADRYHPAKALVSFHLTSALEPLSPSCSALRGIVSNTGKLDWAPTGLVGPVEI